jgi:hypothetical protein
MSDTDVHDTRHRDALSRQVVALREEVQEFKNIIAGCRYVVPLSEAHRIHAARLPDIARAIATTMERLNARLSAAPREVCEPPCSCASLRAKGHNAACSRCPPTVSPTRAAAEVHHEVMLRDDPNTDPAIYERGGYVAPHAQRRCSHIPEGFVGLCMQCRLAAPASCWQCEAPLGTTEACLTCAAKRREDAQRTPTEN